ncbi:MAG TPA: hypothetical protein VG318_13020 [Actinomycetota bacterium]|nr:hypothetical protein [Actinomycetota bacterium]
MNKRVWSVTLAAGLIASCFALAPAGAQDAPIAIPDVVQIDDPIGDANGINDQDAAYDTPVEGLGDNDAATIGNATDLGKVWFTHTTTEVSLNVQVNGDPSGLAYDTYYRFSSNVGEGEVAADTVRGCLQWIASVNGTAGAYDGPTEGNLTDKCNVGTPVVGPLKISEGPDGTFVMTITFPRSYSPLLVDGSKLTAPFGVSRIVYANNVPQQGTSALVTLDNTKRGTDYDLAAGSAPAPETPDPVKPPKPKPGKSKGCDKGKGKKKGCKPAPPAACAPYVPGELGKDAPAAVVTDAHTAEAPLSVPITLAEELDEGVVEDAPHAYVNVQVDSALPTAGLYVTFEFVEHRDYDLWAYFADGTGAAASHGFQPAMSTAGLPGAADRSNTATNHGGESTSSSENLVGIITPDCGGYTIEASNYLGEGGDFELKLWLGEGKTEPGVPE